MEHYYEHIYLSIKNWRPSYDYLVGCLYASLVPVSRLLSEPRSVFLPHKLPYVTPTLYESVPPQCPFSGKNDFSKVPSVLLTPPPKLPVPL